MNNQQAARYARWAAITALALTLMVAGFYGDRALRAYIAGRHGPPPVPAAVAQRSADFSYSDVQDGRTIFTIRASHATRFKDEDRALLQDVWVTVYGKNGDRDDNIHTRECSYQPEAGNVQCAGEVDIDMEPTSASPGKAAGQALQVKTSDLTFNRKTGQATTSAPVKVFFPGGQGQAVGLDYESNQSLLRLDRNVDFEMPASERTSNLPVSATAATLEFRRDDRTLRLGGPVVVHQGNRELTAALISIGLDQEFRAQTFSVQGNPVVHGAENGADFTASAQNFEGSLDETGALRQIVADGNVNGVRRTHAGQDHFTSAHVEFAMVPGRNLLRQMTAAGGVSANSQSDAVVRTLKTDALRVIFATPPTASGANGNSSQMDKQQIESAETLGAATIESKEPGEVATLSAAKFTAQFAADGKLVTLLGHSGVAITRTPTNGAPQTSTASELVATFGTSGDWATLDETGKVRLADGERTATANHTRLVRATGVITLDGSPVFSDLSTRTSAGSVVIDQKTGAIRATGGVVSTELAAAPGKSQAPGAKPATPNQIALGQGDAHISADTLTGSTVAGNVTFRGHARLWQGQAVLDADQIDISQQQGQLDASGRVVAVFPQEAAQGPRLPAIRTAKGKTASTPSGPLVWQIRAPRLSYLESQGRAHLEGGVTATSEQGSLQSQALDVYLAPANGVASTTSVPITAASSAALGGRALSRVVAQGNVVVSQGDLRGRAEEADYDAAQGKFVLSGGHPTITDGTDNTTTGGSLTFYVASDTILVDSIEGSRTLTRHRVEK